MFEEARRNESVLRTAASLVQQARRVIPSFNLVCPFSGPPV
jgi:hypothetical protein